MATISLLLPRAAATPIIHVRALKRLGLIVIALLVLTGKPFPVVAGDMPAQAAANLQNLSLKYAAEGTVVNADQKWTRIDFARNYVDPVVVITEPANKPFVVGVRNVDETGFEIKLKSCDVSNKALYEGVAYEVMEKDRLPVPAAENELIKQRFSWGGCVTANQAF
jgi:hypothetical protein